MNMNRTSGCSSVERYLITRCRSEEGHIVAYKYVIRELPTPQDSKPFLAALWSMRGHSLL